MDSGGFHIVLGCLYFPFLKIIMRPKAHELFESFQLTNILIKLSKCISSDLRWTGITIDEGPGSAPSGQVRNQNAIESHGSLGPYIQSERVAIYAEKGEEIVERGGAYKCFCTEHRLELMRKDAARRSEYFRGYDNR